MKTYLILSPSKEMNAVPGQQAIHLNTISQQVQKTLQNLDRSQLAYYYKINDKLLKRVKEYHENLNQTQAKAAYLTYQGLAFRQIDWSQLDLNYANQHLRILSALYGPLKPTDPINPYRLDLQVPLKIQNQSLKTLWSPYVNRYFNDATVYNLASQEFSQLISDKEIRVINIQFVHQSGKKMASASAKKLRGQLANHLLLAKNFNEETFNTFLTDQAQVSFNWDKQEITYVFD